WTAYRTRPTAEARDVIVERYIHLVRYMARRLGRALPPSVDADDLVGAGIEGFLGAVERFDPDQGTDFSVYALTRIRGAMVDFVREIDPVGRTTRRRLREAGRAVAALEQDRGREISDAEAAEQLVLQLYYVEDLNFREIAMIMDISESRATQLHTAAVHALRSDGGCLEAAGALAIA